MDVVSGLMQVTLQGRRQTQNELTDKLGNFTWVTSNEGRGGWEGVPLF